MYKLIRKTVGAMALLLMFTVSAAAQDKAAVSAKKITENMKEQLSLNDSQYSKVLSINQVFLQKAIENKDSAKSKTDKAKRMKDLNGDRDAKLKSVLSDDQFKKYVATKTDSQKKLREQIEN